MLGQSATSGLSGIDSRIFVYEVAGLRQNEITSRAQAPIRTSDNQRFQVPFHRMNEEMQRILLLGGKIVDIRPLDSPAEVPATKAAASSETSETAASED
ncbi:MAG: phycobilisome linker polypeptide [Cyanobacteria bacterium J06598_3]